MSVSRLRPMLALILALLALSCVAARAAAPVPRYVQEFVGQGALVKGREFSTSFESVAEFSKFYIVPQNHRRSSNHDLSSEERVSGQLSHKAWIYAGNPVSDTENTNHRAYPTVQFAKSALGIVKTAVLVEFWVWADIDLARSQGRSWFSLATFTSYDDIQWYRSYLINVDADYRVHLMHVPTQGESAADIVKRAPISLPRRKWARITAYIDYGRSNRFQSPFIAVWQDGVVVAASRFSDRISLDHVPKRSRPVCLRGWDGLSLDQAETLCNLRYVGGLAQAHFGLYAPPLLTSGTIFNDDLSVAEVLPTAKR
jgi:hypothetical protein